VGQKASITAQFNSVHILPEEKFPNTLPIETFLKINDSNERKIERRALKVEDAAKDDARGQFVQNAKAQSLIVIPEFDFKHVVYKMTELNLSSEGLIYAYQKCAQFLGLKDEETAGVTVLLTKKWIMVVLTEKPYMHQGEYPCYLDGFAYAGFVQLQQVENTWPETVGSAATQQSVFGAMKT
jgi:hypothetical protein